MRALAVVLLASLLVGAASPPTTIRNDDSCDISLLPAATLLLPYFEVDFTSPAKTGRTTIFTVQNTTPTPQIARVTLWTDWAYPMLTFNIFLTGYGVQGINLWDVFNGTIAQTASISSRNDTNPHFLPDAMTTCANLPSTIDPTFLKQDLQPAFTTGNLAAPGCADPKDVGTRHANAVGYATIDVVANCNYTSPQFPRYFTDELLFDNVLTGDYQQVNPNPATGNFAAGSPLVHIRAIPEGGPAGSFVPTALPFTFYDLYTIDARWRTQDRRQPLPSAFMPRYIQGGTGAFNTNLVIWREAVAAPTLCPASYSSNALRPVRELVRFDEHENQTYYYRFCLEDCRPLPYPLVSALPLSNSLFPSPSTSGDVGGWMFVNADNGGSKVYSTLRGQPRPSQAWVVTSMFAEGRFAVEMDAIAIGNGCSPIAPLSTQGAIGPAPNITP